jgi:hypothetical protein
VVRAGHKLHGAHSPLSVGVAICRPPPDLPMSLQKSDIGVSTASIQSAVYPNCMQSVHRWHIRTADPFLPQVVAIILPKSLPLCK